MNLRVTGVGPIRRPPLPEVPPAAGDPGRALTGTRPVCFSRGEGICDARIYARDGLGADDVLTGPAVIEEYGATIPLHPGFAATVDTFGSLRITRTEDPRTTASRAP